MQAEQEKQQTTQSLVTFRLDPFQVAFGGIVILAAILRFYNLAGKPFHHDESLYSVYCWRFFKGEGYKYDPMMHGPFMFLFQGLIFFLFGVGDFSARLAPAFFGTLMIAGTYLLKDHLGKIGTLFVAAVLTLSPTHLYFSRFMREDIYVAFFIYMATIFGVLYYRKGHLEYFYLTAAALALMFCVKESAYIHAFIFITFIFVKDIWNWLRRRTNAVNPMTLAGWGVCVLVTLGCLLPVIYFSKHPLPALLGFFEPTVWAKLLLVIPQLVIGAWMVVYWIYEQNRFAEFRLDTNAYGILLGTSIFLGIYIVLYSTFFHNRTGVIDGLAQSWIYWWNQHSIQRIKGPFHYYVPFALLYELPVVLIAGWGVVYRIATTLNRIIIVAWAILFSAVLLWLYGTRPLPLSFAPTHMEFGADLIMAILVLGFGLWATLHFLTQRDTWTAFLVYSSAFGFLIYCYAGEKVPWLFLHILVPVILLAGMMIQHLYTSELWRIPGDWLAKSLKPATLVGGIIFALYTLHSTVLLNYYHPANPVETMVYTQTSTDMLKFLELVENVRFNLGSEEAKKPFVAVQGNAVWPLAWYLRDVEGWFFPGDLSTMQRPLVVVNWEDREKYKAVFREYQEIRFKLREWWLPQPNATLKDWWRYFLYRKVFNPTGSSDVLVYVKPYELRQETP